MSKALMNRLAKQAIQSSEYIIHTNKPSSMFLPITKCFVITSPARTVSNLLLRHRYADSAPRIVVIGDPGSGKTTLLRFLAYQLAERYVKGMEGESRNSVCPILVSARDLSTIEHLDGLIEKVAYLASEMAGTKVEYRSLKRLLSLGRISLLVDGLDEILGEARFRAALETLVRFPSLFPRAPIVLSSRPVYFVGTETESKLNPRDALWKNVAARFLRIQLIEFTHAEIHEFVRKLGVAEGTRKELIQRFLTAISKTYNLADVARNPLMLTLLWSIYRVREEIPRESTLFSDFADYILSTWEYRKNIGSRSLLSLDEKYLLLEEIAYNIFEGSKTNIDKDKLRQIVSNTISGKIGIPTIDSLSVLIGLISDKFLCFTSPNTISFSHLIWLEYFVARAIKREPTRVVSLISRPDAHEIIMLACELVDDPTALIKTIVEKRELFLAIKCISRSRKIDQSTLDYVIREFQKEAGDFFVSLLMKSKEERKGLLEDDACLDLARKWRAFGQKALSSHEKGRLFEEFSVALFSQVFKVVTHNFNTENGEIDILIEITKNDPFWIEFGGDALVECKNWNEPRPLGEVSAFIGKVGQARVRLAFFVSVSGFTDDAMRILRNNASNVSAPLIVPIDGNALHGVLEGKVDIEEFLKARIRDIKYVRKY